MFKGRDQQDIEVKLKVQYFREKLQDSFNINETFSQFLDKSVKSFVILHMFFQSAEESFILQFLNNMDKNIYQILFYILAACIQVDKNNKLISL